MMTHLIWQWLVTSLIVTSVLLGLTLILVRCLRHPADRVTILRCAIAGSLVAPLLALVPSYPSLLPAKQEATSVAAEFTQATTTSSAASRSPEAAEIAGDTKPPAPSRIPLPALEVNREQPKQENSQDTRPKTSARAVATANATRVAGNMRPTAPIVLPRPVSSRPAQLDTIVADGPAVAEAKSTSGESRQWDWQRFGVNFYLLGLLLSGGWMLLGFVALVRLLRSTRPAGESYQQAFSPIKGASRERVDLRLSQRIQSPLTFPWLRATVILPDRSDLEEREVRWCLAHEWSHIKCGDTRFWPIVCLGRWLYFFQPLFWLASKQLYLNQDFVADAFAARSNDSTPDYAEFLVAVASTPQSFEWGLGIGGGKSDLYRRIVMVVKNDNPVNRERGRMRRCCSVVAAVFMVALAAMLTRAGGGDSEATAADPATAQKKDEKVKTSAGRTVTKSSLRYMQRGFSEWRNVLESDLDPNTRIGAISALRAFGRNGYREEAAEAIGPFIIYEESYKVIESALSALVSLRGVEQLTKGLELVERERTKEKIVNSLYRLGPLAKDSVPAIAKHGLTGERSSLRRVSCDALREIKVADEPTITKLRGLLDDEDREVALSASTTLIMLGKAGEQTFQFLTPIMESVGKEDDSLRSSICQTIERLEKPTPDALALMRLTMRESNDRYKLRACLILDSWDKVDMEVVETTFKLLHSSAALRGNFGYSGNSQPVIASAFRLLMRRAPVKDVFVERMASAAYNDMRRNGTVINYVFNEDNRKFSLAVLQSILEKMSINSRHAVNVYQQVGMHKEHALPLLPSVLEYIKKPVYTIRQFGGRSSIDRNRLMAALEAISRMGPAAKSAEQPLRDLLGEEFGGLMSPELVYNVEKTLKAINK